MLCVNVTNASCPPSKSHQIKIQEQAQYGNCCLNGVVPKGIQIFYIDIVDCSLLVKKAVTADYFHQFSPFPQKHTISLEFLK